LDKEHELRAELQLHECLDLGVGVLVLRPADEHVGVGRDDLGHDGREVLCLGWIDLLVDSLDASGLEPGPDVLRDGLGERVVELGVGGRLGTLVGGQGEDPVSEHVARLHDGGGLDEEQVVELLCEDLGAATGGLEECVAISLRDL